MLEALEEENFTILPKKAYIRGFVKSFVKTLGGNQKEAIKILEATHRHYFPEEYITSKQDDEILQSSELPSGNIVKATLIVAGILAVFAVGLFLFSSDDKKKSPVNEAETKQEPKETQNEDVSPTRISSKTPLKTGTPQANEEEVTSNKDQVAKTKKDQEKSEKTVKAEKDNQENAESKEKTETEKEKEEEKITLRPFPENLYQYANVDHQEQVEEYIPQQMRTVIPNKENLFIRATEGKTWLAYKADDKPVKTFTLQKGDFTLIRANTIRIFFGNVRATKIFLNNKLISTQSRTGVKSLVFPEEKKDQFKLPLFIFKDSGQVITSEEFEKQQQAESN